MGIPTGWKDKVQNKLIWRKTVVTNDDGLVPVRILGKEDVFNQTHIVCNLDFDFVERIYNIEYFGLMDIMSKLGGLRSSILPIIGYLMPLFALHFLWSLAGIIDDKMELNQKREMLDLVKIAKKQF